MIPNNCLLNGLSDRSKPWDALGDYYIMCEHVSNILFRQTQAIVRHVYIRLRAA